MAATTASRRYARAIFELALQRNELDAWANWLPRLAGLAADKEAGPLLANLKVPFELKQKLLQEKLPGAGPLVLNLAYLMVQRGRIGLAGQVAADYAALLNSHNGISPALVKVAAPIGDDQKQAIAARLAALTGKKVQMQVEVDPSIIGGLVALIGDKLYDGSLRRRFDLLKQTLA